MIIYNYDPLSGEFISQSIAREDPMEEGRFLIPAHATGVTPPGAVSGEARCFIDGAWVRITDKRGETWFGGEKGRTPVLVEFLGDPEERGLSQQSAPLTPEERQEELAASKVDAIGKLRMDAEEARQRHITAGDGKALSYDQKKEEALDVKALVLQIGEDATNDLVNQASASVNSITGQPYSEAQVRFKVLMSTFPLDGPTLVDSANTVIARFELFRDIEFVIGQTETSVVQNINAAASVDDVIAAYEAAEWII